MKHFLETLPKNLEAQAPHRPIRYEEYEARNMFTKSLVGKEVNTPPTNKQSINSSPKISSLAMFIYSLLDLEPRRQTAFSNFANSTDHARKPVPNLRSFYLLVVRRPSIVFVLNNSW